MKKLIFQVPTCQTATFMIILQVALPSAKQALDGLNRDLSNVNRDLSNVNRDFTEVVGLPALSAYNHP